MTDTLDKALFDPGFSGVLIHFLPSYQDMSTQISSLKNFNQRKFKYQMTAKSVKKAFESTFGFWCGCILWGVYLRYKFQNAPKEIEGNSLLEIDQAELQKYMFDEEFDFIENYMKNYPKETKYFLGREIHYDKKFFDIFYDYREFCTLNEHFVHTKMTSDIKLPKKFERNYSESELEEIYNKIMTAIAEKDLSKLIE